ncbi:hypothetical protein E2C01_087361 [Portunus trituberculatus]|uniref:Uncharacterized protein n=1 Tax=Portunus trituberculatus TaxID=210409 RepID=A0A5B7J7X0_PORTR|nr:hypothetical protein [Portunus trituberculatus]
MSSDLLTRLMIDGADMNTVWESETKKVHLEISLSNRADLLGQVPGGMDEIPTLISKVRHKPTWKRDLADFRN